MDANHAFGLIITLLVTTGAVCIVADCLDNSYLRSVATTGGLVLTVLMLPTGAWVALNFLAWMAMGVWNAR